MKSVTITTKIPKPKGWKPKVRKSFIERLFKKKSKSDISSTESCLAPKLKTQQDINK